ncbi:protein inturned [Erinaceus europaeus]|uniref:Protein inturned n=1 Tax=Erinaceus europaeus TaxID=9365 RepID=A0ABM3WUP3_ERIEU|nr:protein inturned [Erinaceus europaeus]
MAAPAPVEPLDPCAPSAMGARVPSRAPRGPDGTPAGAVSRGDKDDVSSGDSGSDSGSFYSSDDDGASAGGALEGVVLVGGVSVGGALEGGISAGGALEGRVSVGGASAGGALEGRVSRRSGVFLPLHQQTVNRTGRDTSPQRACCRGCRVQGAPQSALSSQAGPLTRSDGGISISISCSQCRQTIAFTGAHPPRTLYPLPPSALEPEWLGSVEQSGELFYLELSEEEGQEGAAGSQAPSHVRFSEQEAVVLAEESGGDGPPGQPALRSFSRMLRARGLLPKKKAGPARGPMSILKHRPQPRYKDVTLLVNPRRLAAAGAGTPLRLLEVLLGIVHQAGGSCRPRAGPATGAALTVHGLQPGGPALKSGRVAIGDILVAVNGVGVTLGNIERVLSCIPGPTQVKLTFENARAVKEAEAPQEKAGRPPVEPAQLLWGEAGGLQRDVPGAPHVVLFLSLRLRSDAAKEEEVLYQYPTSEAAQKLRSVRGVFLTLCDMLESVTGSPVTSSSLLCDGTPVHVAYRKERDKLLVLGLPASEVPLPQLRGLTERVVQTLTFMYGSLESAFGQQEHVPHLDHLFCLLFQRTLRPVGLPPGARTPAQQYEAASASLLDSLPAVRWLSLPREVKTELDAALSDLESADSAELSEDVCDARRLYSILGSSLFYKGLLLCSHLPRDDLLDIAGYCHHQGLLTLAASPRVGQLVVWREVFPRCHLQPSGDPDAFQEPGGRYFLLAVGLKQYLLCALLEAGGCSAVAVGHPGPDCVYVDRVRSALQTLLTMDARICLQLDAGPGLACADWLLARAQDGPEGPASSPLLSRLQGNPRGPSATPPPYRHTFGHSQDGEGGGPSAQDPQDTPHKRRELGGGGAALKVSVRKPALPNPFRVGTLRKEPSEKDPDAGSRVRLTSGAENTLLHYVAWDSGPGVLVTPTAEEVARLGGSLHPQLVQSFHRCCLSVRTHFQQRTPSAGGTQWPASSLLPVREFGVLMECSPEPGAGPRRAAPAMTCWTVGRRFLCPRLQELYLCFHDSVAEVAAEAAFKLFCGLSP